MVDVGVGDKDMGDGLAPHRLQQRIHMLGQVRAGIDHGYLPTPDDVSAGAMKGEGARIARDHAAQQRRQFIDAAVLEVEFAVVGDGRSHVLSAPQSLSP